MHVSPAYDIGSIPDSILNDVKGRRYSVIFKPICHRLMKQKKYTAQYIYIYIYMNPDGSQRSKQFVLIYDIKYNASIHKQYWKYINDPMKLITTMNQFYLGIWPSTIRRALSFICVSSRFGCHHNPLKRTSAIRPQTYLHISRLLGRRDSPDARSGIVVISLRKYTVVPPRRRRTILVFLCGACITHGHIIHTSYRDIFSGSLNNAVQSSFKSLRISVWIHSFIYAEGQCNLKASFCCSCVEQ